VVGAAGKTAPTDAYKPPMKRLAVVVKIVPLHLVGEFAVNQSHQYALTLVQNSLFFAEKLIHVFRAAVQFESISFFKKKCDDTGRSCL